MRITFPGHLDSNFAELLASKMGLLLISPIDAIDSASGMPSDDITINQILKEIADYGRQDEGNNGFMLNNFPHNVIQAQSLDMALARANQPLDACIMPEATKMPENRVTIALIRYYRSQNKLILIEESLNAVDVYNKIHSIYEKRRSHNR